MGADRGGGRQGLINGGRPNDDGARLIGADVARHSQCGLLIQQEPHISSLNPIRTERAIRPGALE